MSRWIRWSVLAAALLLFIPQTVWRYTVDVLFPFQMVLALWALAAFAKAVAARRERSLRLSLAALTCVLLLGWPVSILTLATYVGDRTVIRIYRGLAAFELFRGQPTAVDAWMQTMRSAFGGPGWTLFVPPMQLLRTGPGGPRSSFPAPPVWGRSYLHQTGVASPVEILFLELPLWVLVLLAAAPTAVLWYRHRRPPGHCLKCGYDLTGNISGICPECGGAVTQGPSPANKKLDAVGPLKAE